MLPQPQVLPPCLPSLASLRTQDSWLLIHPPLRAEVLRVPSAQALSLVDGHPAGGWTPKVTEKTPPPRQSSPVPLNSDGDTWPCPLGPRGQLPEAAFPHSCTFAALPLSEFCTLRRSLGWRVVERERKLTGVLLEGLVLMSMGLQKLVQALLAQEGAGTG